LLAFATVGGRTMFAENCAPCHGPNGSGRRGYPNLADDVWLWGGRLADIHQTIRHGIRTGSDQARASQMPRFGADGILTSAQIIDVAEFVLSLTSRATDQERAGRGARTYAESCAACHGDRGEGKLEFGAPRLNSAVWLYGGDRATIIESIVQARGGVMPAWAERLDQATIKMLAIYVHGLGGGQ
jgi:cytochrome c oxidase cbb3-type subunit III